MNQEYKILLVEDEPDLVEMFSAALQRAGFKVETLKDGSDIIKHIKNIKPDLVLLDLVMPKKDGYQVLQEIKCDEAVKHTLVYVFSNLTQKDEIAKAKKLGAKGFLIKSDYTPSKLAEKINEVFCDHGKKDRCQE